MVIRRVLRDKSTGNLGLLGWIIEEDCYFIYIKYWQTKSEV